MAEYHCSSDEEDVLILDVFDVKDTLPSAVLCELCYSNTRTQAKLGLSHFRVEIKIDF